MSADRSWMTTCLTCTPEERPSSCSTEAGPQETTSALVLAHWLSPESEALRLTEGLFY